MKRVYTLLIFLLISSASCFAQEEYDGVPYGIKTDTTIFLKFDMFNCEDSMFHKDKINCKYHNKKAQMGNAQLDEQLLKYPYPYKVMFRSEFEANGPGDCTFIFDNRFQQGYNSYKYKGASKGRFSYFYLLDQKLNRKYKVFEKPESWTYQYGLIIKALSRSIKKM